MPDEYDASVTCFQDIGEAAARAGAALAEWAAQSEAMIEELVSKLTPEQGKHYLALVAGGSCKLNALVEIERIHAERELSA